MKTNVFLVILLSFFIHQVKAQEETPLVPKKTYTTTAISSQDAPVIDGILDDKTWDAVDWAGDFIQRRPHEGKPPSQQTEFKVLYDDRYMYVALKCWDTQPDSIVRRLSRRDGFEGDFAFVAIDSYHDLQTSFLFAVTAAGVKGDEFITNNGNNSDESWNPIWYTKTNIDNEGWTAEMKIPFSQLRFDKSTEQIWGFHVVRQFFRENERSTWQPIPQDAGGWVSNYGELRGIKNLEPKRQVELQPYAVTKLETYEAEDGNPFRDGSDLGVTGGLDGKIGITNNLTLDFTINPDFGQVEADPAAIALDGFQIFFREQRPFFVENKNIFDYSVSPSASGNTFGNDNLFYSRRIGKNPSGYPDVADGEYMDMPNNTTILGAAKISGKTKEGWSIGVLESVTAREYADIDNQGEVRQELVEPLTNYFVGRVKKDFNNNNSNIGGIFTSTHRKLEGNLDFLHKSATTGGLDFKHQWDNNAWYLSGNAIVSHVTGSKDAITSTQESIGHLFQREGADHVQVDTAATDLTGTGGHVKIGKTGNGNLLFETGVTWRSPGLELNDNGFMRRSDDIRNFIWAGYRWRKPFGIFNFAGTNYNHWIEYDYAGNLNNVAFNVNGHAGFKNNWFGGLGTNITPYRFSNYELRGGPRFRVVPEIGGWVWLETDRRKKLQANTNVNIYRPMFNKDAFKFTSLNLTLTYQPINALSVSLGTNYFVRQNQLQYVTEVSYQDVPQYIAGTIDQRNLSFSLRLNYTINPNLTLQYYGQPFIARGTYTDFKYIVNPLSPHLEEKSIGFSSNQISLNDDESSYQIDQNNDGSTDFSFGNPDFAFVQFRSNLVLRWEYIPGSELFFVWSQGTTGSGDPTDPLFRSLDTQILNNKLENIFLIKATYRLVL